MSGTVIAVIPANLVTATFVESMMAAIVGEFPDAQVETAEKATIDFGTNGDINVLRPLVISTRSS